MKWIKISIGAVIAIISLGIIATSVSGITQETVREKVVTFEVLTETTITGGTYDSLHDSLDYAVGVGLPITFTYNSTVYNGSYILSSANDTMTIYFGNSEYFNLNHDDTWFQEDPDVIVVMVGDTFDFTLEVAQPPQLTGTTATLILLAPLIFVGGVLGYLLYKQNGLQD